MAAMTTASRTSGVAPLAVFFDAVDDVAGVFPDPWDFDRPTFAWTSGVYQPPLAEYTRCHYEWDFGDPGSGTWSRTVGNKSRNSAIGFVAGHVYEVPGTYTATLRVYDVNGVLQDTYTQTITVSAFAGATYYAAATPVGTQDGSSPANAGSFLNGMNWVTAASDRQLLLKRGDSFSTGSRWLTSATGNIIDAYGTGPDPIINVTAQGSIMCVLVPRVGDWRIRHLDLRATSTGGWGFMGAEYDYRYAENLLTYQCSFSNWEHPLGSSDWGLPNGVFVVDCDVGPNRPTTQSAMLAYISGRRLCHMGNNYHDAVNHLMRITCGHKVVVSNNNMHRQSWPQRHIIKLHGPVPGEQLYLPETRWICITDNDIIPGGACNWTVSVGGQSIFEVEACHISHILVERNHFTAGSNTDFQDDFESEADYQTIRNNVFNDTPGTDVRSIRLWKRNESLRFNPHDAWVYNNTAYKNSNASGGGECGMVVVTAQVSNVRVRNNLYGVNTATAKSVVIGPSAGEWINEYNLMTTSPGFANAVVGDYSLAAGSPAIAAGLALPEVRADYVRALRSVPYDIGAYAYATPLDVSRGNFLARADVVADAAASHVGAIVARALASLAQDAAFTPGATIIAGLTEQAIAAVIADATSTLPPGHSYLPRNPAFGLSYFAGPWSLVPVRVESMIEFAARAGFSADAVASAIASINELAIARMDQDATIINGGDQVFRAMASVQQDAAAGHIASFDERSQVALVSDASVDHVALVEVMARAGMMCDAVFYVGEHSVFVAIAKIEQDAVYAEPPPGAYGRGARVSVGLHLGLRKVRVKVR